MSNELLRIATPITTGRLKQVIEFAEQSGHGDRQITVRHYNGVLIFDEDDET